MLNEYRKEGLGQTYPRLFQVINNLDSVQEAFESILDQNITVEALTRAIQRLTNLEFLPKLKKNLTI